MKKRQFWQRYRNDIVAMLVYNLIAGGLTLIYEVLLAGASTEQWLISWPCLSISYLFTVLAPCWQEYQLQAC